MLDNQTTDRGERRAQTARDHDDRDLIDRAGEEPQPDEQGRSGGGINRRLGTRDERKRADDPDDHTRVQKADERDDVKPNERPGPV